MDLHPMVVRFLPPEARSLAALVPDIETSRLVIKQRDLTN